MKNYPPAVDLMLSAIPYETGALAGYSAFRDYCEKGNNLRIPLAVLSAWALLSALRLKNNGWGMLAAVVSGAAFGYIQENSQKTQ